MAIACILALLTALLLPAAARAKASARTSRCTNNQRQAGPGLDPDIPSDNHDAAGLTHQLGRRQYDRTLQVPTNPSLLVEPPGFLFARYLPAPAVYKCPADASPLAPQRLMNNRLNPDPSPDQGGRPALRDLQEPASRSAARRRSTSRSTNAATRSTTAPSVWT